MRAGAYARWMNGGGDETFLRCRQALVGVLLAWLVVVFAEVLEMRSPEQAPDLGAAHHPY